MWGVATVDITDPELDPRWAANYDQDNLWREDDEFYLALVGDVPARVVDLGCGTGRLTISLAVRGHSVLGVDPNPAFLVLAAQKPRADRVAWIRGTSADIPSESFDFALMTSHVAQVFITDAEWDQVLADLRRALVPGGILAFESRDPAARAWEDWARDFDGEHRDVLPDGTVLDTATTTHYRKGVFRAETYSVLSDGARPHQPRRQALEPGTTWSRAEWAYRFRSRDLLRRSLRRAGFVVDEMLGGWKGEALGQGCGEIVVLASVPETP